MRTKAPSKSQLEHLASLFNSGDLQSAEVRSKQICKNFPNHAFAWKVLGAILKIQGKNDESLTPMKRAVELAPNDFESQSNLGVLYRDTGRLNEAASCFKQAIKISPNNTDALNNLGVTLLQLKRFDDAISVFHTALKLTTDNPIIHYNLANAYRALGIMDKAEMAYRNAIRHAPHFYEAICNLGATLKDLSRLEEAIDCYRESIRINPEFSSAYNNLGVALKEIGKSEDAEKELRTAIQICPSFFQAYNNLGLVLCEMGRAHEGENAYRKAIEINAFYSDAYLNLANQLAKKGSIVEAEKCCRDAIRVNPNCADIYNTLGIVLKNQGKRVEEEACYREAIAIMPSYHEAYYNLGNLLKECGNSEEAKLCYLEAIILKDSFVEAHFNLGNIYKEMGQYDDAEKSYKLAIQNKPSYTEAYLNLGNVYNDQERFVEAITCYKSAIKVNHNYAEAFYNLGNAQKNLLKYAEAESAYKTAINLNSDHPDAYCNLGIVLNDLGNFDEAESAFRKALEIDPGHRNARSNLLFTINFYESYSAFSALDEACRFGNIISSNTTPKFTCWQHKQTSQKIKIAFVSGDLRSHPVGFFVESLLKNIDKARFEIYVFSTTPIEDDTTARIKSFIHEWIQIYALDDFAAATKIHSLGVSILFDLSGHTALNRISIFSYKPAPIQVSWLGYFATSGLPEMDYLLGDPYVTPLSEENHFREKIWRLPESYLCFTPPTDVLPAERLPALSNGFLTFGCFNNLSKMGDAVISVWANVLRAIPKSKLFLKTKQLSDTTVIARVVEQFASHGISEDRLILEGPSNRLDLLMSYNRVDIALDPFPYPGGTTSAEALWMGVPVLTLRGDRFLSHVGESIAHNVGHSDWIALDTFDYVYKAISFSADLQKLSHIRLGLRSELLQTPLFDAKRFSINFEAALEGMLEVNNYDTNQII